MLKKLAVVGSVVAVAGLGVGGVAAAWSGPAAAQAAVPGQVGAVATTAAGTSTGTPATGKKHTPHDKRAALAKRLGKVSHAQWVSKDAKTGTFVTHDAVRGDVTAAGAGSITIKATDGTTETFLVTGSTKVRVAGTKGAATAAQIKVGDRAVVLGTGSGTMTATRIVDRGAPGSTPSKHRTGSTAGAAPSTTTTATTAPSTS